MDLAVLRRWPRLTFFAFGAITGAIAFWLLFAWPQLAREAFWLPWLLIVVVVLARIRLGRVVRPIAFSVGVFSVYAATMGSMLVKPAFEHAFYRRPFDPVRWKRAEGARTNWPLRLRMVDDIIGNRLLDGLTRDSVERLLGPRDRTDYFADWDLVYWLGPERGMIRIDSEWLVVRFGTDGRVREYRIVRD